MKKTFLKIAVCVLIALPALSRAQNINVATSAPAMPPPAIAEPSTEIPATTNAPAKPKKARTTLSVTGKVVSVDTNTMALTIGKRTYDLTSDTRITKAGQPATLGDISVDDKVSIAYKKDGDKLDALTISDGKKAGKTDAGTKPATQ